MPPRIGITTYGEDERGNFTLPREYVDCVRRAGGLAVLIPPGEQNLDAVLDTLDGLILAGGGDLDPSLYGGAPHPTIYMVDPERDRMELALARAVVGRGVPTFAICRGAQVVNVALGGTLLEHLPDVVGNQVDHRLPPREPAEHQIQLDPLSRLACLLRQTHLTAASWHHQAVRQLGVGLIAVGWAEDHTIEAIELPGHPFLIGVQWHPEMTAKNNHLQQKLFDGLVSFAAERIAT